MARYFVELKHDRNFKNETAQFWLEAKRIEQVNGISKYQKHFALPAS